MLPCSLKHNNLVPFPIAGIDHKLVIDASNDLFLPLHNSAQPQRGPFGPRQQLVVLRHSEICDVDHVRVAQVLDRIPAARDQGPAGSGVGRGLRNYDQQEREEEEESRGSHGRWLVPFDLGIGSLGIRAGFL